ncbi:hypothetical protein PybrP1_007983 [[Pythium] brassicae (nom. inval.)]|nr:hypothetical protein PybrP1_007983 [[Pythium] brassicae (nom. inval.)]
MKRTLLVLAAAASATAALHVDSGDGTSYVVQLHAARDGNFVPDAARTRSQVMALASGQRFECFVPLTAAALEAAAEHATPTPEDPLHGDDSAHSEEQAAAAAFLAFGRTAAQKIRPKCVQFVDMADNWVYEVCPGVLVRRVSLRLEPSAAGRHQKSEQAEAEAEEGETEKLTNAEDGATLAASTTAATARDDSAVRSYEVVELGQFVGDSRAPPLAYSDFVGATTQERVRRHEAPLFTQTYRAAGASSGDDEKAEAATLQVQFLCSASAVDDTVAGVQWRPTASPAGAEPRAVAGFLVLSRVFCDPQHADADEFRRFTVPSLLQPLVDARTCVKRSEGWWTYEFCFGRGIRQYHRDSEGKVTAEFSLGTFDAAKNEALGAAGGTLVMEHIDATHDVARPAFVELYDHGTHCKEFEHYTPRRAKVYYYCSPGGASHHILAVKETQTCAYAIKVSSPALCDHPHFLSDEQKSDAKAEVVHCVPLEDAAGPSEAETEVAAAVAVSTDRERHQEEGSSGKAAAADEL